MDLTSIEPSSVAIRAGQAVASELMCLLSSEEALRPIEDWYAVTPEPVAEGDGRAAQVARITAVIEKLGGYVCHAADAVVGERLYRWAAHENLIPPIEWGDRPFAQRHAFELFALVVRSVYRPLKAEQDKLEAADKPPPVQQSLALEDSIFEEAEPLDAIREEFRGLKGVAPAKPVPPQPAPKKPAPANAGNPRPQSIGERPVARPENRGGRGNRKEE